MPRKFKEAFSFFVFHLAHILFVLLTHLSGAVVPDGQQQVIGGSQRAFLCEVKV